MPQPVYMNLSDYAAAREAAEDSLDLKTPTADDFAPDPPATIIQQSNCNGKSLFIF